MPTPNVVLIHTHDTGRYIQPYGYDLETPCLQGLADEGTLFRQAFCAGPTCSPSRGAMMTGQAPHSNGLIGLTHRGFSIDDYSQHLIRYLARNGFETALCGKEHESPSDGDAASELGYERFPEDPGPRDGLRAPAWTPDGWSRSEEDVSNARAAAAYVREDHERPFFLSLGFFNTHRPFEAPDAAVDPDRVRPPEPLPDVPAVRRDMAGYAVDVYTVDRCVGHVLDALRDSGRLSNTLVLFTTDHGIAFPRMKCNLFDGGIGVSLLARFPERWHGRTVDALVSQLDLYPTLCEFLDLDVPPWVQGNSLLPLLRGDVESVRDAVFSEVTFHAAYEPKRCVRTERYKYIRRFDGEYERYVLANVDDGPSKEFLVDHGLGDRVRPREALYDCYFDPNEADNLVDDPEYAGVRDDLADRLETWMEETDDPLLDGPVPKPAGAEVTSRDAA